MKEPIATTVDGCASGRGGRRLPGRVIASEPLGSMVRLRVLVPGWTGAAPGQFALLDADSSCCFLGRALSISAQTGEEVSFLLAPVGVGTRGLCSLDEGSSMWVLGPLGNGFDVEALSVGPGRTLIVGGGVGVAPFPLLLSHLAQRCADEGREVIVLLGFRDAEQALGAGPLSEAAARLGREGLRCRLEVVTEDGSSGSAEKVTDLLRRHLKPGDRVAVCGPEAMARAVWCICSAAPGVKAWFSLEANMACGVGSCHGCVVGLADGSYARVCHEGPVFAGEEVFGG
jgi:dihydroorotate dehydrogenase electron transfer subunit